MWCPAPPHRLGRRHTNKRAEHQHASFFASQCGFSASHCRKLLPSSLLLHSGLHPQTMSQMNPSFFRFLLSGVFFTARAKVTFNTSPKQLPHLRLRERCRRRRQKDLKSQRTRNFAVSLSPINIRNYTYKISPT